MASRREFVAASGAVAASTLCGCASVDGGSTPRHLLGAFPGDNPYASSTIEPFEEWLGRTPAVITLYYDATAVWSPGETAVREQLTRVWSAGHVPMVTWQPHTTTPPEDTPETVERDVAEGSYDHLIERWAVLLDEWLHGTGDGSGHPHERRLYFRPFPEMNGDWHPWSAADSITVPGDLVSAWIRMHDWFESAGMESDQIQWLWNPDARDAGPVEAEAYYPGDEYVDWLGIDGYNFGTSTEGSSWESPSAVFSPMLDRLEALADKPMSFPEFGSTSLRDGTHDVAAKADWITGVYDLIRERGVEMSCWFNVDKETDWAVFGGGRGTDAATIDGTTYEVYDAYREAVTREDVLTSQPESDRLLTDEQFFGSV